MPKFRALEPYLYLSPALLLFGVFTFAPLIFAFYLALTDWDLIASNYDFVWFDNFIRLATDHRFIRAVKNTIYFSGVTVPVQMALALTIAVLLNARIRLRSLFRAIYFTPVLVPVTVAAIIWLFIFSPSFGIMNYLLEQIGLPGPAWFSDAKWAMPAIMILAVWQNFGYHTIIFLAGLQSIPQDLVEAAHIDGASKWQAFWRITFPLLAPTTFLVLVISVIGSFQVYQTVVLTTGGSPAGATTVIVFELYRNAFEFFNMGYAAAMAVVLFLVIFLLTLLQFKFINPRIHYR
jgi:multiple sugar transport system permease protein